MSQLKKRRMRVANQLYIVNGPVTLPPFATKLQLNVTKKQIDPKLASVAATFYEPVYQRLRQWHNGRAIDLLCFVNNVNKAVKELLQESGARPSQDFRARCFAEIWEVPHETLLAGAFRSELAELDVRISEAMGCLGGKYSAVTGNLLWADTSEGTVRRHSASRLVQESLGKSGRRH